MNVIFWTTGIQLIREKAPIPYRYIGPYKLAHWIRAHGYTAQVIDFVPFFNERELYDVTVKFITKETVVLGISTTFLNRYLHNTELGTANIYPTQLAVLKRIKTEYPHIKIVLGGTYAESIGPWGVVDAAVIGKSEDIFLELVEHYIKGTEPPKATRKFPNWSTSGLVDYYYEAKNKKYDIEKDNFRWHESDCILPNETLPLEVSRGCIFKCKFCQYELLGRSKLDYLRSASCIEEELIYNYEKFNVKNYHLLCDTFNDSTYKMDEWYKMTQRLPFKIHFCAYIRADLLERFPDVPYQLKESGLLGAFHGIETFEPGPAMLIGKGWSGKRAKDYIPKLYHDIWKKQVSQKLSFIIGLPGSSKNNGDDTIKWFVDNDMHSLEFQALYLSAPWKNSTWAHSSEFDKNAEKYGFKFKLDDWKLENHKENGGTPCQWYHDDWNWQTAITESDRLNLIIENLVKFDNWSTLGLMAFDFEIPYILSLKIKDWPTRVIGEATRLFVQTYKTKIKSI